MHRYLLRLVLALVLMLIGIHKTLPAQITPLCASGCQQALLVTPTPSPVARIPSVTDTAKFVVENQLGYGIDITTLNCVRTSYVASCTVLTAPGMSLNDGQWDTVRVAYTTASSGTTGTIKLNVYHDGALPQPVFGTLTVNYTAPTPPLITLVVPRAQSGSRALVATRTPIVRALLMPNGSPVDTTRTTLRWRGTQVKNARHNRGLLEWAVDSARALALPDSALVEVTACSMSNQCTTVNRWAVLLADGKPLLGMTALPLGIVGSGLRADLGTGLFLNQAELETDFSIPSYTSMGSARGAGLTYSTRQSYPRALIPIDIELTWPAGTPDEVRLVLREGGVGLDSMIVATPTCSTGATRRCRGVLQADYSAATFPTPTRKWLTVEVRVTSAGTVQSNMDSVEVVLVDRRTTAYGSGWWPTGVLQVVAAGADRLLINGNGSATIFRGNGDSLYVSPPGVFATLVKTANGWDIRSRGSSTKATLNISGQMTATIDGYGNADSIKYDGSGRVATLKDPVGKLVSLAYDANGKLQSITDPAGRQSKVTISNTTYQLTYDSLSSPAANSVRATWAYQAYPGLGTVVMTRRIGVIQDTVSVLYDSTFKRRPKQSRLPLVMTDAGWANPVVLVQAMESKGLGVFVSLDSAYAQVTDPRGFWTRVLTTASGRPRRTWDAVGLLARAAYNGDGVAIWKEGKSGDSSRVYYVYDSLARPVTSYALRSLSDTLRSDSLVYDNASRLIRVVDARGKTDSVQLDTQGSVLRYWDKDNNKTQYWYRGNGQLDSVRAPLTPGAEYRTYDATFKNISAMYDVSGKLAARFYYDAAGRDTVTDRKIRVLLTDTVSTWQWRRERIIRDDANRRLTAAMMRSNNCTACSNPPSGTAGFVLTDTLKTRLVTFTQDRGGRDSVRQNERGVKTLYIYDRLGRLVQRRPWSDSTAVQDSMVYDLSGNRVKLITRRGYVITSSYDGRNRDTLAIIPTVGTLRNSFAGPLDQLTRTWVVSPVDSIGGVNGEVRFAFDQRGRLRSDTAYTGTQVRATTYAYDRFERDSAVASPTGTFTTRWDTNRELPRKFLTPYGDSLTFTFDARQRPTVLQAQSQGNPTFTRTLQWSTAVLNAVLTTDIAGYSPGTWSSQSGEADDPGPALGPTWYVSRGAGMPVDSFHTTASYDGWERLLTWKETRPGGVDSASYIFDRMGNVSTAGGGEVFDATTGRLLQQTEGAFVRTYAYDRSGNLVTSSWNGTTSTYGYDALDRLVSVRLGTTLIARYGYDVSSRRIAKRVYSAVSGGTVGYVRYVLSGEQVAFETDSTGAIGNKYTWGLGIDDLVGVTAGATQEYAVSDRLGSVRGLVKRDGTWLMSQRFDPYGRRLSRDSLGTFLGTPYQWNGREYDQETGWYYVRARFYSPGQRRFVQEDPTGYDGGLNPYSWVDGKVLEGRDPSGKVMLCTDTFIRHTMRDENGNVSVGPWIYAGSVCFPLFGDGVLSGGGVASGATSSGGGGSSGGASPSGEGEVAAQTDSVETKECTSQMQALAVSALTDAVPVARIVKAGLAIREGTTLAKIALDYGAQESFNLGKALQRGGWITVREELNPLKPGAFALSFASEVVIGSGTDIVVAAGHAVIGGLPILGTMMAGYDLLKCEQGK